VANVVPELLSSIIIRVQQARGDDMWVWLENPTGNYTVNSSYRALCRLKRGSHFDEMRSFMIMEGKNTNKSGTICLEIT